MSDASRWKLRWCSDKSSQSRKRTSHPGSQHLNSYKMKIKVDLSPHLISSVTVTKSSWNFQVRSDGRAGAGGHENRTWREADLHLVGGRCPPLLHQAPLVVSDSALESAASDAGFGQLRFELEGEVSVGGAPARHAAADDECS